MTGFLYDNINLNPATLGSGQASVNVTSAPSDVTFTAGDAVGTQRSTGIALQVIGGPQTISVTSELSTTDGVVFVEATLLSPPVQFGPFTAYSYSIVYQRTEFIAADHKAFTYITVDGNDIAVNAPGNSVKLEV